MKSGYVQNGRAVCHHSALHEFQNWVLLVMAIMSWVSQGRSPIEYVLIQLADPLLRPIRRILPGMGGIDFSPMILVLLLYVINMGIGEVLQATGNMLLPGLWMAL